MKSKEEIQFAVNKSTFGEVMVARSARGVCAILMGDSLSVMLADLQKRFPHAQMVGGDGKLDRLSKKVIKFIENPQSSLNISLDIRGTGFQRRVWGKLQKIPVGTTASYKDIANQLKMPQSMRAVAGACAANPLAVVIPCHRVVKNDGSLSGYRWGIKRKQKLLELEGVKRI